MGELEKGASPSQKKGTKTSLSLDFETHSDLTTIADIENRTLVDELRDMISERMIRLGLKEPRIPTKPATTPAAQPIKEGKKTGGKKLAAAATNH